MMKQPVNRWVYIKVLEEGLLQAYNEAKNTARNPIFQQDNARIHTAKDTIVKWLEDHGIEMMKWPACLPDLNPIEHCWKSLKEKLHQ